MISRLFRFPTEDPAQAMRARHMLLAGTSYVSIVVFVVYCSYIGLFLLPPYVVWQFVALSVVINAGFYVAICSGFNLRFSDPSMTLPQIGVSLLWMMFVLYFMDQVRGAVLLLFLTIFLFGIFRLRKLQFIVAASFALAGYAAVIGLLLEFRPSSIDLRIELLQLLLLALVLPWFALIGAYISNIRSALRLKNRNMERALKTIEHLASHDELTGAHSRRYFMDALRRECARGERDKSRFCLALFDLDWFKSVNDQYGHLAGDAVLRAFAECVEAQVRQFDYFARYGGEEFALLLIDADMALANAILERIREVVAEQHFPGVPHAITTSIGVTEYRVGDTPNAMIGRADHALYAAKESGRNRVAVAATAESAPLAA